MRIRFFDVRQRSLIRGTILVIGSLAPMLWLSDFPHNRATPWLILPVIATALGTADTARCIQRRWSFYHGGVILCLYMDLMCLALVCFALVYPYVLRLAAAR